MAIGSNPVQVEDVQVGGGYGDPGNATGAAGGVDIDNAGNVSMDGDHTLGGDLIADAGNTSVAALNTNATTVAGFGAMTTGTFGNAAGTTEWAGMFGLGAVPTTVLDITGTASTDTPVYTAEFLSAAGWTSTGWTGGWVAGWAHTPGNVSVLSQSTAALSGYKYQIAYTVTGRTAGSFTVAFGGTSLAGSIQSGAVGPTTVSTANLTITPTTDFDGTIVISIKRMTAVSPALITYRSSDGTIKAEIRASTGPNCTFIGKNAGAFHSTGDSNTTLGWYAGSLLTTGNYNTLIGASAGREIDTGYYNTIVGESAGWNIETGYRNELFGTLAGYSLTTAYRNVIFGGYAAYYLVSGYRNTIIGDYAGYSLTGSANSNTFIGNNAGYHGSQKVDAANSTALGNGAYTTADNQMVYGNASVTSHVFTAGALTLATDLDVTEGGTGVSTLTDHGVLLGSGSADITPTAAPTTGQLLVGYSSNDPYLSTMTGDVTLTANGTTLVSAVDWANPGTIGSGTPSTGAFTTLSATGVITSTLAIGTSPFTVTSTTVVPNLNVSQLLGATWAAPGTIGSGTPATGAFTTLSLTGNVLTDVTMVQDSAATTLTISAHHDTEATSATLVMRKSDNTAASPALVDDNAVLGTVSFHGYDGSGFHEGARIEARIDGTPSDGTDMPTELTFWTTPDASATALERMAIRQDGKIEFGNYFVQDTVAGNFKWGNTGDNLGILTWDTNKSIIGAQAGSSLELFANNVVKVTVSTTGLVTMVGDLAVNGGDVTSSAATVGLFDVTPTKVNFAGNAAVDIGKTGLATTVKGTLNVDEAATFDSTLTTGDGGSTNYTAFAADGLQTMVGTAVVSKDINFSVQNAKFGGSNDPDYVLLDNFNLVLAFDGAAEEEVFAQVHIPHDYMPGTDMKAHFHWAPSTAGGGAASVTWAIEYTITKPENNELITAGEVNSFITDVEQNLQYEHLKSGDVAPDIDGTGVAPEDIISMRIFRDPTGALGTDDYAQDAYLLSFDIEYLVDRIGEDSRW